LIDSVLLPCLPSVSCSQTAEDGARRGLVFIRHRPSNYQLSAVRCHVSAFVICWDSWHGSFSAPFKGRACGGAWRGVRRVESVLVRTRSMMCVAGFECIRRYGQQPFKIMEWPPHSQSAIQSTTQLVMIRHGKQRLCQSLRRSSSNIQSSHAVIQKSSFVASHRAIQDDRIVASRIAYSSIATATVNANATATQAS